MNQDTNDSVRIDSIGQVFRQARERLGIDIKQAADAIHLKDAVIQALETDDFDSLPSQVFVRGYIRSYAKLLDIDERPLLAIHSQFLPEQNLTPEAVSVEIKKPRPGLTYKGDPILLWTLILFISIITGFALAWWINQDHKDPAPLASIVEQSKAPGQLLGSQSKPPSDEQVLEPKPEQQQQPDIVGQDVEPQQQPDQQLQVIQPASADEEPLLVNQYTLSIRIIGKSWMEVVDQDRNKILYGLYEAGTVKTFTATGQLNIFLGNSPAVEVWLNDQLLDHSGYMYANNVARFDVNKMGLVSPSIN